MLTVVHAVSYQSNNCDLSVTSGGCVPEVLPECLVAWRGEGTDLVSRPFGKTRLALRSRHEREAEDKFFGR